VSEQKKERHYSTLTEAEAAQWDAEMDADQQKAMAAIKQAGKRKRGQRHIGGPWEFWTTVRSRTLNGAALTVAMYVYRRTVLFRRRTLTLVGSELAELKVDRTGRHRALLTLAAAGLVKLHQSPPGSASKVELLWKPSLDGDGGVAG
jgi:hypothetical protein